MNDASEENRARELGFNNDKLRTPWKLELNCCGISRQSKKITFIPIYKMDLHFEATLVHEQYASITTTTTVRLHRIHPGK